MRMEKRAWIQIEAYSDLGLMELQTQDTLEGALKKQNLGLFLTEMPSERQNE